MVERIILCNRQHITDIEAECRQAETGTESEIFAVAFVFGFVVVANASKELFVVGILQTNAEIDFLELFFGTARRIGK